MNAVVSVASLASVTAVAAPLSPANAEDAELLALGEKLEHIIGEWLAASAFDARAHAAHETACELAGFPRKEREHFDNVDELLAYDHKRSAVRTEFSDCENANTNEHGEDVVWNDIHDRLFPLCARIMTFRPHTVVGLGVMARAISVSEADLWEEDVDGRDTLAFIRAVSSFAGVMPVREQLGTSLTSADAVPVPPPADPTFALIKRHRAAWVAWDAACPLQDRGEITMAELNRLEADEKEAAYAIADCEPTTRAGAIALLRYVADHGDDMEWHYYYDDEDGKSRPLSYWVKHNCAEALESLAVAA